ncbi:MAG: GIY-YIG nuclease family protein [Bacteroidales bacterium]|nr:GIY-YIG nuclease family protein [Bacteroidales bacterium]
MEKVYYTYVLYSKKHNKIYIGYTGDLQDRLRSHNEKATKGVVSLVCVPYPK